MLLYKQFLAPMSGGVGSAQQHVGQVKENATFLITVHLQTHIPGLNHALTIPVVQVRKMLII